MNSRQNRLDEQFSSLGQSLAKLESLVEIFGLAQTNQVKVQSQVYEQIEQMQNEMYVTRGLLADVSSSASNLQATIEGTSTRMAQQIATISGLTENVFRWGWLLLVVAFLIHYASGTRIPLFPIFFFATPLLLATVAVYLFPQNFPAFRPSRNLAFSTGPLLLSSDGESLKK